jgi:acid phosphatase type 7
VMAHHPPFTAVSFRQGQNAHMRELVPLFEKYRVSATFFGHDHNYQHFIKNDVHYVTTGGGGAPLYDVNRPVAGITQRVESVENFVAVSVDGEIAHVQTIAVDGRMVDSFEIKAPGR